MIAGSFHSPGGQQWYGNEIYRSEQPALQYHRNHFGDPHTFGFKDLVPWLMGEKGNAEEWATRLSGG